MVEPPAAAAAEATVHVEAGVEYELEYQRFAPEPLCLYVPHSYLHTHRARELSSDNEFWAAMAAAPHSDLCPVRADAAEMSKDQFNERFCRPDPAHGNLLPALVSGLTDAWPAREAWQIDALRRSHGEALFAVAGGRVTLANYLRHATSSAADWPFYVFDDDFSGAKSSLLEDYRPHDYFDDVLCLPAGDRPSPRYFLLGPRASGTCMHQDPMATSAWNTLLAGRKRWCLFPPHVDTSVINPSTKTVSANAASADEDALQLVVEVTPRDASTTNLDGLVDAIQGCTPGSAVSWGRTALVPAGFGIHRLQLEATLRLDMLSEDALLAHIQDCHGDKLSRLSVEQRVPVAEQTNMSLDCPAYWFKDVWPTLKGRESELGMLDFIQQPGETIFVPHGWHHIVLNLDWTVAITHNFISQATAQTAYAQLKAEDPSSARQWHRLLTKRRPDLASLVEPTSPTGASELVAASMDTDDERSDDEPHDPIHHGDSATSAAAREKLGSATVPPPPPPLPSLH